MANTIFDDCYAQAVKDVFEQKMKDENVSIETIAKKTNTKYNTLYRYLDGSRQIPIDLFKDICVCLNMNFEETFRLVNEYAVNKTLFVMRISSINKEREEDIDEIQEGTVHPTEGRL